MLWHTMKPGEKVLENRMRRIAHRRDWVLIKGGIDGPRRYLLADDQSKIVSGLLLLTLEEIEQLLTEEPR